MLVSGVLVSTFTHREINIVDEDRDVNVFGGEGWHTLIEHENLVAGTKLVLTNLLNNTVSLMPFLPSGLEMRHEVVERMPLNFRKPFVKSPIDKGLFNETVGITLKHI